MALTPTSSHSSDLSTIHSQGSMTASTYSRIEALENRIDSLEKNHLTPLQRERVRELCPLNTPYLIFIRYKADCLEIYLVLKSLPEKGPSQDQPEPTIEQIESRISYLEAALQLEEPEDTLWLAETTV